MKLSEWPRGSGSSSSAAAADMRTKLQAIIDAAIAEAARQQSLYDKETNYGEIADAQRRWLAKIARQLNRSS